MSESRAGGLDLESLERFARYDSLGPPEDLTSKSGIILALIAEVRALRTALRPFAAWYDAGEEDDDSRPVSLWSGNASIYYAIPGERSELTLGDLRRAADVVGAPERDK